MTYHMTPHAYYLHARLALIAWQHACTNVLEGELYDHYLARVRMGA
jgi:hypothetical protein